MAIPVLLIGKSGIGKISISRAKVTKAIKDGEKVAGATLNERQNLQIE